MRHLSTMLYLEFNLTGGESKGQRHCTKGITSSVVKFNAFL